MAVTQEDIDGITKAIASGERQVTIGGQTVTYRSISDLLLARDTLMTEFKNQQIAAGEITPRPRQTYLYYAGRGYDNGCQ